MIYKFFVSEEKAQVEFCFYLVADNLSNKSIEKVKSILSRNGRYIISRASGFRNALEIGPQTNFKTAWCQNMLDIFHRIGLLEIERIEHSIRYANRDAPDYDKMLFRLYFPEYFENSIKSQIGHNNNSNNDNIEYVSVKDYNRKMGLNLSYEDELRYEDMFQKLGRQATNVEVYDLSQSQSEHARHWFFKGEINREKLSLFDKIKSCYQPIKHKTSLISFYDNASVVEGGMCNHLFINHGRKYEESVKKINFSYKAETHNFPTGISPFPGAATGSGGRIRDLLCVGKGGQIVAGTAGYCVGDIPLVNLSLDFSKDYKWLPSSPQRILIEASNGASDYGNKIGEPLIQGFTRSYRQDFNRLKLDNSIKTKGFKRIEWLKPIMFSGGMGIVHERDIKKEDARDKLLIVRVGGPAYRIGMGGGSASSRTQSTVNKSDDFQAVQRGDPLMANKLCRFLRCLVNRKINPIVSIHDQGSGGMANVTREIAEGMGATVYLDRVFSGDPTLNSLEKWVAEYQEQITLLVNKSDFKLLKIIGKRENISVVEVGEINNSKHLRVWNKSVDDTLNTEDDFTREKAVDIPMEISEVRKKYQVKRKPKDYDILDYGKINLTTKNETNLINKLEKIFSLVDVGSKQFLTNKVDRSVGGLVVQQQCIGPFHLPLSNLAAIKGSFDSSSTLVSAIGEKPIVGVSNTIEDMVNLTVGEMLTNIIWCQLGSLSNINSVANWMWPSIDESDGAELRDAVNRLTHLSHKLEFSINGGKDSLSMKVRHEEEEISAPATLTLSGYATIYNHFNIISPNLKSGESKIILIRLDKFRGGMLGSAYSRFYDVSNKKTQWLDIEYFPKIWKIIQKLINQNIILSGHDISDGGLITTLVEMAISSYFGLDLDIQSDFLMEEYFFSEELGLVIEVSKNKVEEVLYRFNQEDIEVNVLGSTYEDPEVFIKYNGHIILAESNKDLRWLWQKTSYLLEREQANPECIEDEIKNCYDMSIVRNEYPQSVIQKLRFNDYMYHKYDEEKPKVAIMRADGSNGEMEMGYAFLQVGFSPEDVNIHDIASPNFNLQKFKGIVWVGGFTFGDVLGAAEGWFLILEMKKKELEEFYGRDDTFSLGVCNGCQLMTRLGWVEGVQMEKNVSGRFESRWSRVKIMDDNNIFFKGLKDLSLGIYSAHGEGRMISVENENENKASYPVRYVDRENNITRKYPFNPNGSIEGRAAALSSNGRHLAIMPHPERTILNWQVPHQHGYNYTPWFIMFKNLYDWCLGEDILDEDNY